MICINKYNVLPYLGKFNNDTYALNLLIYFTRCFTAAVFAMFCNGKLFITVMVANIVLLCCSVKISCLNKYNLSNHLESNNLQQNNNSSITINKGLCIPI